MHQTSAFSIQRGQLLIASGKPYFLPSDKNFFQEQLQKQNSKLSPLEKKVSGSYTMLSFNKVFGSIPAAGV
jgi:hypothetical protein